MTSLRNELESMGVNTRFLISGFMGIGLIILLCMTAGINDNGFRVVVQYPWGTTFVKFTPGIYLKLFGKTSSYADVITTDLDGGGVKVRYQDGGTGHIDGVVRASLPTDEETMLKLHRAVREEAGLRNKLIYPEVKQALNLTAGLMTSEEAYAVRRNDYADWASDQVENGRYRTTLQPKKVVIDGVEKTKDVPTILRDENQHPLHQDSPFAEYGIRVVGFQITDWGFEDATLTQIQNKRQAEMAVITAKANAEKARQEKEQVEAEGERNVALKKYKELEEAQILIVQQERDVEVAKLEIEKERAKKEAAKEYAAALDLRSKAEAEAKRRMMLADGALEKKLATYEKVSELYANAVSKQKWVPEVQMGSSETTGSSADALIQLLTTNVAKDLSLDMSMKGQKMDK